MTRAFRALLLLASAILLTSSQALAASASPTASASLQPDCTMLQTSRIPVGQACMRVIQVSVDSRTLSMFVDGSRTPPQPLAFNSSPSVFGITAGSHRIQVSASNAGPDSTVLDAEIKVKAGRAYEIVLYGEFAALRLKLFPMNLSPVPVTGVRLRFINVWREAGTVDVAYGAVDGAPASADAQVRKLSYAHASGYIEATAPTKSPTIQLYTSGTGTKGWTAAQIDSCNAGGACSYVLFGPNGIDPTYEYSLTQWSTAAPA